MNIPQLPDGTITVQGCTVAQLFDLMKLAAREVQAEMQQQAQAASEAADLPDEVPAAMAAKFCGYATGKSLVQYHYAGLMPMRTPNCRLFYRKAEVIALKKKLFNQ